MFGVKSPCLLAGEDGRVGYWSSAAATFQPDCTRRDCTTGSRYVITLFAPSYRHIFGKQIIAKFILVHFCSQRQDTICWRGGSDVRLPRRSSSRCTFLVLLRVDYSTFSRGNEIRPRCNAIATLVMVVSMFL